MFLTINQQVTPVISLALSAPFRWVEYQDPQTPQDGSLLVLLVVEAALGCQGRRHTKGALCNSELFSNVYCKEGLSPAHAPYLWRLQRLVFSPRSWRTLRAIWTYALVLITLEKRRLQGQAFCLIAQGQLTRKDYSIRMKIAAFYERPP